MCVNDAGCSKGETCISGVCTKPARRPSWRWLLALLWVTGCVSAADLRLAGSWVDNATRACPPPCADPVPRACFRAALELAAPTSGRKQLAAAATACAPYRIAP